MIHLFVGTKAQFIKMVPIMRELENRGIPYNYIDTGQHAELTATLRKIFNIAEPDYLLTKSKEDITKVSKAVNWFLMNAMKAIYDRNWLKKKVFPKKGICLVHGDTLSTLLGTFMAILSGVKVCHVEAGLRSYNWIDPFPEEIIRLICMKLSTVLFAPSKDAFENLKRLEVKGEKILVSGNTVIDSIHYIKKQYEPKKHTKEKYAVATCHRLETISDRNRLSEVIDLLNQIAKQMPVYFVIHKPTRKYIEKYGLFVKFSKNIIVKEMLDYPEFLALITFSEMVLTDGGSIQEECDFLNIKCLIIRNETERKNGLGTNAMLWSFDKCRTDKFINWQIAKECDSKKMLSPSKEIVDYLVRLGYN